MAEAILKPDPQVKVRAQLQSYVNVEVQKVRRRWGVVSIGKLCSSAKPVSLFPTPVGPEIARTSGFDKPIFLLNSQEAIEFVIALTAAVCPAIAFGKLLPIDKNFKLYTWGQFK